MRLKVTLNNGEEFILRDGTYPKDSGMHASVAKLVQQVPSMGVSGAAELADGSIGEWVTVPWHNIARTALL